MYEKDGMLTSLTEVRLEGASPEVQVESEAVRTVRELGAGARADRTLVLRLVREGEAAADRTVHRGNMRLRGPCLRLWNGRCERHWTAHITTERSQASNGEAPVI